MLGTKLLSGGIFACTNYPFLLKSRKYLFKTYLEIRVCDFFFVFFFFFFLGGGGGGEEGNQGIFLFLEIFKLSKLFHTPKLNLILECNLKFK